MKKNYTHISMVLDASGSMQSTLAETTLGFNNFVNAQKKVEGTATLSLVQFSTISRPIYNMVDIHNCAELNKENYKPDGYTALLDAIGDAINETGKVLDKMDDSEKPEKVIFVIITDGGENASKRFNRLKINEMINHQRSKYSWEFVFIGANQDSFETSSSLGMNASNSINYIADDIGTRNAFESLTKGMTGYRLSARGSTVSNFFSPT